MRIGMFWRQIVCTAAMVLSAIACADSDQDQLDNLDKDQESPASDTETQTVADLTTSETVVVPGVSADVTVVIDRRGAPHIYANKMTDALRAEGYIMARDRFAQMEFIRRAVTGTLTEVLAPVAGADSTLDSDQQALFFGFKRIADSVYAGLADDDIVKTYTDAYVAGVNTYIAEITAELAKGESADLSRFVPRGDDLLLTVLTSSYFREWTSEDVLAIARYQTFVLSVTEDDLVRSLAVSGLNDFGDEDTQQQALNAYFDMTSFAPAREVYTTDTDGPGAVSVHPARTSSDPVAFTATTVASIPKLDAKTRSSLASWITSTRKLAKLVGDKERGSNNWVVSGEHTASGAPILANDPHLSLTSPAVWYYMHLIAKDDGIDVEGVSFAGLPGVTLGFNQNLAWGATVTNFDIVDFYALGSAALEGGTGPGMEVHLTTGETANLSAPSAVEVIHVPGSDDVTVPIYTLDNFGQILFVNGAPASVAVRTINTDASNELGYFFRLLKASSVAEGREAQATYFQAGSQNFVYVAKDGDIAWQTYSRVPSRPAAARTWDGVSLVSSSSTSGGHCPTFVLPSDASMVWDGNLESTELPALLDPAKGWISTANQDSIGVTKDGNPCNDGVYLGGDYDPGYRDYRIASKLDALVARGGITVADMQALQATSTSSIGETVRTPLVESLGRIIASGTYDETDTQFLSDVRDRLSAWTLETPAGTDTTDASVIADSIATTLFNVGITRIIALAFGDERQHFSNATLSDANLTFDPQAGPLLERALNASPSTDSQDNSQGLASYNSSTGDTELWDNIDTDTVETRDTIVAQAFLATQTALQQRLGSDENQWRWGKLHTVTFTTVVPASGLDVQSIPAADDPLYANGFPRHSDWGAVDVGSFSLWNAATTTTTDAGKTTETLGALKDEIDLKDFSFDSGPSQRLVVEMLPDGPKAYNVLPGGQSEDPNSSHHADEAALWVANEAPALNYVEADVAANAELKIVIKAQ